MKKIKQIINIIRVLKIGMGVSTIAEIEEGLVKFYMNAGVLK